MHHSYTIAQLSDLHIGRELAYPGTAVEPLERLRLAAAQLAMLEPPPDLLLLTGDFAEREEQELYRSVQETLDHFGLPWFPVLGNHDRREWVRELFGLESAGFPPLGPGEYLQYVIDHGAVRVIVLDSQDEGRVQGLLDRERLDWLEARLKEERSKPTLIVSHHHPFDTGMPFIDKLGLHGRERLAALIAQEENIEAYACGHIHRAASRRWAGTVVYTCPSISFGFTPEFTPVSGLTPIDLPPALRLFRWQPETGLIAHLFYVDAYRRETPP